MRRFSLPLALSVVLAPQLGVARAGLVEYVKKADDKFAWKIRSSADLPAGKVYDLDLTSQKWEKIAWKHHLLIFQPKDVKPNATMLLYITGDYNVGLTPFGFELATTLGELDPATLPPSALPTTSGGSLARIGRREADPNPPP